MAINNNIEHTIDEIQAIMDAMDKRTFGGATSMEWEGSIQNAPNGENAKEKDDICGKGK